MDLLTRLRTAFEVRGPWIALVAAAILVETLVERHVRRRGITDRGTGDLLPVTGVGALLTARLVPVLGNPSRYLEYPADLVLPAGDLSLPGAVIGGAVAFVWYARRRGLPVLPLADALALYLPLGFAVTRLGCLPEGACYGETGPRPFAVAFAGLSQPRYPVELYDALAALLAFGVLLYLSSLRTRPGLAVAVLAAAYPTAHALLGFLRINTAGAAVTGDQAFFFALALAGVAGTARLLGRSRAAPAVPSRSP